MAQPLHLTRKINNVVLILKGTHPVFSFVKEKAMGKYSDGCPDTGHDTHRGDCENSMFGHGFNPKEDGGKACFPSYTLIDTPLGKMEIGSLTKGQIILSYNPDGLLVPRAITRKRVRGTAQVFRVDFENGSPLFTAAHHSFLTEKGWKKLADMRPGEKLVKANATIATVARFTRLGLNPVFNIYTAGEHNFIADGVVAHNFTEFRTVRTALHRLFLDPVHNIHRVSA